MPTFTFEGNVVGEIPIGTASEPITEGSAIVEIEVETLAEFQVPDSGSSIVEIEIETEAEWTANSEGGAIVELEVEPVANRADRIAFMYDLSIGGSTTFSEAETPTSGSAIVELAVETEADGFESLSPPTGLSFNVISNSSIELIWTSPLLEDLNVRIYQSEFDGSTESPLTYIGQFPSEEGSFLVVGLESGIFYRWYLSTSDGTLESPLSEPLELVSSPVESTFSPIELVNSSGGWNYVPDEGEPANNISGEEPNFESFNESPVGPSNAFERYRLSAGANPISFDNFTLRVVLGKSADLGQNVNALVRLEEFDGNLFQTRVERLYLNLNSTPTLYDLNPTIEELEEISNFSSLFIYVRFDTP